MIEKTKEDILDIEFMEVDPQLLLESELEVNLNDLGYDFKSILREGEEILWVGKPQIKRNGVLLGGGIILFGGMLFLMGLAFISIGLSLVGVPILLMVYYGYYHRVLNVTRVLKYSFYDVTNQACYKVMTYGEQINHRLEIEDISKIERGRNFQGEGTIFMNGKLYRSAVGPGIGPTLAWSMQFDCISDVESVYQFILQCQEEQKARTN